MCGPTAGLAVCVARPTCREQKAPRYRCGAHIEWNMDTPCTPLGPQKGFRSNDVSNDGEDADFRGQSRSNKTHESTTDADAQGDIGHLEIGSLRGWH